MDCIVHGVAKSRTRLSDVHFQFSSSFHDILLWSGAGVTATTWMLLQKHRVASHGVNLRSRMCLPSCVCAQWLSHVQLFATPWTVAPQAPLSMGFPR